MARTVEIAHAPLTTEPGHDATPLDPAVDAARIRAFYVHSAHAHSAHIRRGIAVLLLRRGEDAAFAGGFRAAERGSMLPGVPFYLARGYTAGDTIMHQAGGFAVPFVPMRKTLSPIRENRANMTQG